MGTSLATGIVPTHYRAMYFVWRGYVRGSEVILAICFAHVAHAELAPKQAEISYHPYFPNVEGSDLNAEVPLEMISHARSKRSLTAEDLAAIDFVGERPQRYSFGLGKRMAEYEEEQEEPAALRHVAKREPYAFGLGKRDPYAFGLGKRDPYAFRLGKREPYAFGLGKRDPYKFGLGKRDPYKFGLGKRAPYQFGLGKREPYAFGLGKRNYIRQV